MNAQELLIAGMVASLPPEEKARYEETLKKLLEAFDTENAADMIAASAFCIKIQNKLEGKP